MRATLLQRRWLIMNGRIGPVGDTPEAGTSDAARYYKRDFWSEENLKFSEPWYRLRKSARVITNLAQGRDRTLLDIGCGPGTLMRLLPENIHYYGIDIAIHDPAPNLLEADILEHPISFGDRRFDIVVAQGVFEYLGDRQSQKFSEVSRLLQDDGSFVVSYTNFGHRKSEIYPAFSNVQPMEAFRTDLERYFLVQRQFAASHNWKHRQPSRRFVKAGNMYVNMKIPLVSPLLAVEYFFICTPRGSSGSAAA
jgi:SAM-dependent methyltransferase